MSEQQKPHCYYCGAKAAKYLKQISKKRLSLKVMAERMKLVNDRMVENLKKAYQARGADDDELQLLEVMDKADDMRKNVQKILKQKTR